MKVMSPPVVHSISSNMVFSEAFAFEAALGFSLSGVQVGAFARVTRGRQLEKSSFAAAAEDG